MTSEWHHFLEAKQRVILLIFEAVDLPKELEKFEWVDFRGSYKAGLKELFSQLKQPIQEEHPVPETGFKAPLDRVGGCCGKRGSGTYLSF